VEAVDSAGSTALDVLKHSLTLTSSFVKLSRCCSVQSGRRLIKDEVLESDHENRVTDDVFMMQPRV